MKATPYKWANNVATVDQGEEQESNIEQIPSDNIAQIVQLVEKLIDLTVDDSNRAEKITLKLLNQVESI